jgi:hypothetical protein
MALRRAAPETRRATRTMPHRPVTEPLQGALVRIPVDGDRWAEDLPPAPRGFDVSVSFSCEEAATVHGEAVALLGYRVVGVRAARDEETAAADVLVPEGLIVDRPRWWGALRAKADRSFGLAFGPVALAYDDVLRLHAEG